MYAGRIVEVGPTAELFALGRAPLHAPPRAGDPAPLRAAASCRHPGPGAVARRAAGGLHVRAALHVRDRRVPGRRAAAARARAPSLWVRCIRAEEVRASAVAPLRQARGARRASDAVGDAVLSLDHVFAGYGAVTVVHDVDLQLAPHECLALVGESGSRQDDAGALDRRPAPRPHGRIMLRGQPLAESARAPHARGAPGDPVRLPEPVRLAQPAQDDRRDRAPAARRLRRRERRRRRDAARDRDARARLARRELRRPLPRPALGRRAPARRDRPRAGRASPAVLVCDEVTSALDVERAGGDRRAARRAAARARPGDAVRHPQPAARALDRAARRGHERGPHRRARHRRARAATRRPTTTRAPARRHAARSRPRPRDGRRGGSRHVAPGFEGVRAAFERNDETGGAFAAVVDGTLVVDLWGGTPIRRRAGPGASARPRSSSRAPRASWRRRCCCWPGAGSSTSTHRSRASGRSSRPPARARSRSRSCSATAAACPASTCRSRSASRGDGARARGPGADRARRRAVVPRVHVRLAGRRGDPARGRPQRRRVRARRARARPRSADRPRAGRRARGRARAAAARAVLRARRLR